MGRELQLTEMLCVLRALSCSSLGRLGGDVNGDKSETDIELVVQTQAKTSEPSSECVGWALG